MPPAVLLLAVFLTLQTSPDPAAARVPPPGAASAVAVRADRPVVIDGKDDDPVWRVAPAITAFREFQPKEDGDPRFATEAKVAYDSRNFYVFVRAFDPHPDSILKLLARRDVRAATDQIKIVIDSYHDRRSGFEFAVNPAGVKRDYAMYNDGQTEDDAWDAVWDVATTVDSLGWTAEFRIPLSQLRYAPAATNTFGFGVWRDIQRYTERVSWPVYRVSRPGFASQLGEVQGLVGLSSPRRLEVTPYGVTKNVTVARGGGFDHPQRVAGGADIKYGVTSNLTLDATVNPDFGQVEADPAVLNLTAFETFFQERRPFFVAGTGVFRFDVNCSQVNCNSEGLFYSRRVGRAPHLTDLYGDASSARGTTIIGAGKLTGRLAGGLNLGVLEGVTARETGAQDRTIEPLTSYAVVRAFQDLRHGESGVGVIATAVDRNLDVWTDPYLRQSAYAGAVDFRHRFPGGRYQLSGSLDLSRVAGTRQAIAATQQSSVHNYQRPDGSQAFAPTRPTPAGACQRLYLRQGAGWAGGAGRSLLLGVGGGGCRWPATGGAVRVGQLLARRRRPLGVGRAQHPGECPARFPVQRFLPCHRIAQRGRRAVVRQLRGRNRCDPLHVRSPEPEDRVPHRPRALHRHPRPARADPRAAVREQGHVLERA